MTSSDEFLSRLERVRPTGESSWVAACPAHDDRVASLSIGLGRDDRIVCHCHAGCTTLDIVDVLGLRLTDLFADDSAPSRAVPARSRPGFVTVTAVPVRRGPVLPRARVVPPSVSEGDVARWMSRLSGHTALLGRLYELKGWSPANMRSAGLGFDGRRVTFPAWAPGGVLTGVLRYLPGGERKMLAGRGVPRDLWPAPESLPDGTVLLVEGEPDAVSGMELGLPTVALPGAGGWKDSWAARFGGRDVVMVADCDGPGRDVAERVRADLTGVASVHVVDLDPSRSDGWDLGDEVRAASRFGELGLLGLRRRVLELAGVSVPSSPAVTRKAA